MERGTAPVLERAGCMQSQDQAQALNLPDGFLFEIRPRCIFHGFHGFPPRETATRSQTSGLPLSSAGDCFPLPSLLRSSSSHTRAQPGVFVENEFPRVLETAVLTSITSNESSFSLLGPQCWLRCKIPFRTCHLLWVKWG